MPERLGPIKTIPLDIVVTETGALTKGMLVAVMAADLDALVAENERLSKRLVVTITALTEIKHDSEDGRSIEMARRALEVG